MIDFNDQESTSIKSFAVKKKYKINVTTRFMSGKLLMFIKLSLKSLIYDIAETFCFPDETVAEIYQKSLIEKVFVYHILTDTDSTAIQFIVISDPNSDFPKGKYQDVILEVTTATKIYKRFDSSHEFWDIFGFRKENRRKKLGYYKIENINNPCLETIAVNPKEYLEVQQDLKLNKKHKGIKNGSNGMGFENFANRIKPLINFDTFQKPPAEYKQVSKLTVDKGEMVKKTVTKTKFSELNDKRFYFPNGILSLPFDHENVKEIDDFKQKKVRKLKIIFGRRKKSC